jgi:hypothetical protein
MPEDLKGAIDQIANSLQTVTLLSTQLRRDLGESAQRVYTQVIDGAKLSAAQQVGGELKSELITIDHAGQGTQEPTL